ncbi:putative formaldehyde dehydrogenase AdhA [Aquimixticola soesokkakensis]|uniref:Putative formaldehyde dehydrogenase AdhA n=1 Tax=Aquimixticola soesokkakensis TaxID=1519096 RepID=A0A1Y5T056_9RHOB|nr:NAD(P)-dependent alcohol dehydrogenase [Aquimixticola soesokkakensis]SLN51044.1 putative formaldehyde dehydrogenase AdhA [Aquimixticola soesokkakensis]
MTVHAYAAQSADAPLAPLDITRRTLRPDDVAIDITYCGVCHSDLHTARNDWGNATYPVVPGHEIIGRVTDVGADVTGFKVGDLVGVGCMVDSCQHCAACDNHEEQYCFNGFTGTYGGTDKVDGSITHGGYAQSVVVKDKFVLNVPENIDAAGAAPLLCAGITTWSPLQHWKVGKGSKVAVVGLGGLGHMALKLAHALGAEVTLFSRSPDKIEDAKRLGADHVVISTDDSQMAEVANAFDLIIDTVPYVHDLNPYMPTLNYNGTLVLVGYLGPIDPFLNSAQMVMRRRAVAGSLIGGVKETQELLDFCGEHGITSDVEVIRMDQINEAYERMLKSDVKYRFVIDNATLA